VRSVSTKDCPSGNETRTQNACASVPIRIVSYSYAVIVPCTLLYDITINVAYKTLSKYFIQVLSFVTPVHITQTATRVSPNYTLHFTKLTSKFPYLSQSAKILCWDQCCNRQQKSSKKSTKKLALKKTRSWSRSNSL